MATISRAKLDVYENVTSKIVELLERGVVPWRKSWASLGGMPRNMASGKHYRGINVFLLGFQPYESPHWLTFKQAKNLGGSVKKGEKSTLIIFWKFAETIDKETGTKITIPILRHYRVFNSAQCELGSKAPEAAREEHENDPISECEAVVEDMPNRPTIESGGGQPAYHPSADVVDMPERSRFETAEAYYATMFHELAHSTGHKSRLSRDGIVETAAFGSATYSREELIAEMGSAFLCAEAGIENSTLDNSAAYIGGWLQKIREDKRLVVQAAGKAQRAADYILDRKFDD